MESFFQTDAWGKFKAATSWSFDRVSTFLRLQRVIGYGRSVFYYPEILYDLAKLKEAIGTKVAGGTIYSRFEFLEKYSDEKTSELQKMGLVKSFEDVQPEYRQWVNVTHPEEDIRIQMKPKGRYNLGIAEKAGLQVVRGGKELAPSFFELYSFTSSRTHFSGRSKAYFEQLMEMIDAEQVGEIILVKKSNELLSGGIFLYYEELGSYLYGGSMGDRSLMAPYLMHWVAMLEAKKRGCQIYDLLAVSPPNEENHPYAGLSRFKSQFGGETVRLLGSWDLVHSSFWYTMYGFAEKRRRPKSTQ